MEIKNFNTYFFVGALVIVSILAYLVLKPFLVSILIAAILSVVFQRPYRFLVRLTRDRRSLASLLTCLLVFLVIVIPTLAVLGLVAAAVTDVYREVLSDNAFYQQNLTGLVEKLKTFPLLQQANLEEVFARKELAASLTTVSQVALQAAQAIYQSIAAFGFWLFVVFFTLYYFFIEGGSIIRKIMYLSPLRSDQEKILTGKFVSMSRATLKGTLVIGLIQGAIGGILFTATGVPYAAVLGVIMVMFAMIPMVGTGFVWGPVGIISLALGNVWQGIVILAVGAGLIATIDNVLRPKLVGRDTQMHPLLVFFATIGGIFFLGIPGFIIGPIILAFFLALWEMYAQEFKGQLDQYNS